MYCWAVQRLGGVCLLLHTTNTASENVKQMRIARCRLIIASPAQAKLCDETMAELGDPNVTVLSTVRQSDTKTGLDHVKSLEDLLEAGKSMTPVSGTDGQKLPVDEQRLAFLCSTSGTSGEKVRT